MTLSELVQGETAESKQKRAETMLLVLANGSGQSTFRNQQYEGGPLYTPLQAAALELAETMNFDAHLITDAQMSGLRKLMEEHARQRMSSGPLGSQFGSAGPKQAHIDAFVDGMMAELTWCIAHFSGLLNRWFTVLKVRDEDFAVNAHGQNFVDVYNASVPQSIKARNNELLGSTGWGY